MRFILAFLLCWLVLTGGAFAQLSPHPQTGEVRVALVVGNSDYSRTNLANLVNAANDSAAIEKILIKAKFHTLRRDNLDRAAFVAALNEFEQMARQADVALFYYAGHAVEVDGVNLLLPTDFVPRSLADARDKAVEAQLVEQRMSEVKKLRMLFLDACRENREALADFIAASRGKDNIGSLAIPKTRLDTQYFFATEAGETATDGVGANSPFTEGVLAQIETPGVELGRFFRRVSDYVLEKTDEKQRPFRYGSRSDDADFYFFPPPPDPCPASTEPDLWAEAEASDTPEAYGRYLQTCEKGANRGLAINRMVNAARDAKTVVEVPQTEEEKTVPEQPGTDPRIADLVAASRSGQDALAAACHRHGGELAELSIQARNDGELELVLSCEPLVAGLDARQQRVAALAAARDPLDRALAIAVLTREDRAVLSGEAMEGFQKAVRESDARVAAFLAADDNDVLLSAYRKLTPYELDVRARREPALRQRIGVAREEVERRQRVEEQRNAARREAEEALRSVEAERNARSLDGALKVCGEWASSVQIFSEPGEREALTRLSAGQTLEVDALIAAHDALSGYVFVGVLDDLLDTPKSGRIGDAQRDTGEACAGILQAAVFGGLLKTASSSEAGDETERYILRARLLGLRGEHDKLAHFLSSDDRAVLETAELEAEGRWASIRAAAGFDPLNYIPKMVARPTGESMLTNAGVGQCVLLMLHLPNYANINDDAVVERCGYSAKFWQRFVVIEKSDPGRADSTVEVSFQIPGQEQFERDFQRALHGASDSAAREAVLLVAKTSRVFVKQQSSLQSAFYNAFCESTARITLKNDINHFPFPGSVGPNGSYSSGDTIELGPSRSDKSYCGALLSGGNREYVVVDEVMWELSAIDRIQEKIDANNELNRQFRWLAQNVKPALAGPLVGHGAEPKRASLEQGDLDRGLDVDVDPGESAVPIGELPRGRILTIQEALARLGLYTSTIDGLAGPGTRAALEAWFSREGETFAGELSEPEISRIVNSR